MIVTHLCSSPQPGRVVTLIEDDDVSGTSSEADTKVDFLSIF